jgi:hypothetical protein
VSTSFVVRPLSSAEASPAARAWNDLADGTLSLETLARIERLLTEAGGDDFAAFGAEEVGE